MDDIHYPPPGPQSATRDDVVLSTAKFRDKGDDVVSHDPLMVMTAVFARVACAHAGDALYRFIMAQARERPGILLHVKGTHLKKRTLDTPIAQSDGTMKDDSTDIRIPVTDFDFYVDIGQHICHGPVHCSHPDEVPTRRGNLYPEVDRPQQPGGQDPEHGVRRTRREKASDEENEATYRWKMHLLQHGLPPWVGGPHTLGNEDGVQRVPPPGAALRSSRSLREWTKEYCESQKVYKEFVYEKVFYGWSLPQLQTAVLKLIQDSGYAGSPEVSFEFRKRVIRVLPDTYLARALSHTWTKVLLWLVLLYPLVWLFARYHELGGGKWEVCGGAYALKYAEPLGEGQARAGQSDARGDRDGRIVQTPEGPARLVGMREGEWFRRWEETIKHRVKSEYRSQVPLTVPDRADVVLLDGYRQG